MLQIVSFLYRFRSENKSKNTGEDGSSDKFDIDGKTPLYDLIRYPLDEGNEEEIEIDELISRNDDEEVMIEGLPQENNIAKIEIDDKDVTARITQLNTEKRFVVWLLLAFYYINFTHHGKLSMAHLDYLEGKVSINDIPIDDEKGALAYAIQNIDRVRMGYKAAGIVSVFVMLGFLIVVGSLIAEHFLDDAPDVDYPSLK